MPDKKRDQRRRPDPWKPNQRKRRRQTAMWLYVATAALALGAAIFQFIRQGAEMDPVETITDGRSTLAVSAYFANADSIFAFYRAEYPQLAAGIDQVVPRLPELRRLIASAYEYADSVTSLAVILQTHDNISASPEERAEVPRSQAIVLRQVTKLCPPVLGWENWDVDPLTLETMIDAGIQMARSQGQTVVRADFQRYVTTVYARSDASVAYVRQHPEVRAIGTEDNPLNFLHNLVLNQPVFVSGQPPNGRLGYFADLLRAMRSEVALARTLDKMRREHASSGTIVVGANHRHDFSLLCQLAGLPCSIYDCQ